LKEKEERKRRGKQNKTEEGRKREEGIEIE